MNNNASSYKKRIFRIVCFALTAATLWFFVPVPSKFTPQANMGLNSFANSISPKLAASGFNFVKGDTQFPVCKISGNGILIAKDSTFLNRPILLTFAPDNIVAFAVRVWLILLAYMLIMTEEVNLKSCRTIMIALAGGAVMFTLSFLLRGFLFGCVAALFGPSIIGKLDDLVRFIMIAIMILPSFFILVQHGSKEKQK